MTDIKYLNAVRVGGVKDGSAVVLAGATENDGIFSIAIQTQEIGRVVCELLRILALPEFEAHAPAKPPMQVAGSQAARPFRVEAVSVAKAPLQPGVALCVDFPAIERITIGLSPSEAVQLAQHLQAAAQSLQSIGDQKLN